jgi:quercetin dioxygenase-like cupin family protein
MILRSHWTRAALLATTALMLESTAQAADSTQSPQESVVREIFGHFDQSEVAGKEIVTGTVTLQPGARIPFHTHPGDETGYVVRGSVIRKVRGQPDKRLHAGDSFFNPRGSAHSIIAGKSGAKVFSAWIVDKDKPMSSPSP